MSEARPGLPLAAAWWRPTQARRAYCWEGAQAGSYWNSGWQSGASTWSREPAPAKLDLEQFSYVAIHAPSLFEAIQQQLGLKLTAEKTQVDVLAIDHVEKPSAN